MGQSTIVAAAFSAAIILFGLFVNVSVNLDSLNKISSITQEKVAHFEQITGQSCELASWKIVDADYVILNVTNSGDEDIRVTDFDKMEIFALLRVDGVSTSVRVSHQNGSMTDNYWHISRVFFNGVEEEILNPMNETTLTGSWDTRETIEIEANIFGRAENLVYLTFIMPLGFESSQGKLASPVYGRATIEAGTTFVIVHHQLYVVPLNVQVTPTSPIHSSFWISNITSTTFTINMFSVEETTTTFNWLIIN